MRTPARLPSDIHPERLGADLKALGLTGVGWSEDGFVLHDDAPDAVVAQIQGVLDAHSGKTQAEKTAEIRRRRIAGVSKEELLEAILDSAKVEALRQRLER